MAYTQMIIGNILNDDCEVEYGKTAQHGVTWRNTLRVSVLHKLGQPRNIWTLSIIKCSKNCGTMKPFACSSLAWLKAV